MLGDKKANTQHRHRPLLASQDAFVLYTASIAVGKTAVGRASFVVAASAVDRPTFFSPERLAAKGKGQ